MGVELLHGIYAILAIAAIAGGFKGIDWMIGQKYQTKSECSKCKAELDKTIHTTDVKLTRIETKLDLVMQAFNIVPKEDK